MGHSQAEKARTHDRIVEIAARRLRERGLEGIGIAELMKEAGLTVGGFYKHFGSRDELVAEAVGSCLGGFRPYREAAERRGDQFGFAEMVDLYLSPAHRDAPGTGCALGALSADLARSDGKTRALATKDIHRTLAGLAAEIGRTDPGAAREAAILAYSAMVGAIGLSRIVDDPALSDEILQAAAAQLKAL